MHIANYIGGEWVEGDGDRQQDVNPSRPRHLVAEYRESTRRLAGQAVDAASRAWEAWSSTPAPTRGRLLLAVHARLAAHRERYVDLMVQEQGKTRPEAEGEFQKGLNLVEFFAGEGFRLNGETIPSESPQTLTYTLRQSVGPVAVITPWNFPFAIPLWKICPALVAGNPVVFKPASYTPAIAAQLVSDFSEAGLPGGVLNLILGSGREVGESLAADERIHALSFTGSNPVGHRLAEILAGRAVKVTMEMGGKNAVVVTPSADLDLAAGGIVQGAYGAAGQRCTATSRVFVHEEVKDALVERILRHMERIVVGPSDDPHVTMGPLISADQRDQCLVYVAEAAESGAQVVYGGRAPAQDGYFLEPTLVTVDDSRLRLVQEEIFGPVLALLTYRSLSEAMEAVNQVPYGLSAAIYSRDLLETQLFIQRAAVGMVHVNNPTIGGEAQMPFGGMKGSGLGPREMGHEGTLFFTETKTVFLDYSGQPRTSRIY